MTSFTESIQDAVQQAASETDMNEAKTGGGFTRELPAAGLTRLRLVGYIEAGEHDDTWQGKVKKKNFVYLKFELSGPKHPDKNEETGRERPFIITIRENLSIHEKSNFYKLFKRMNHTGEYKHMAQMLGNEFMGVVVHTTKGEGSDAKTYANLRDDGGYTIRPPYVEDAETGESKRVKVAEAQSPTQCFILKHATKEMWDSIFIDGRYPDKTDKDGKVTKEGQSKNFYQNLIRAANNFKSSPIAELLFTGGEDTGVPDAEKPARKDEPEKPEKEAEDDPLKGIG